MNDFLKGIYEWRWIIWGLALVIVWVSAALIGMFYLWFRNIRGVVPSPGVHGLDLTATEKKEFGMPEQQLAFYQDSYISTPNGQVFIRPYDIIIGIDNKKLEMTARQFLAYVKVNYNVGDRITYNILRDGERLDVPVTLTRWDPGPRSE
jgi:S1-C subfamily serine protease